MEKAIELSVKNGFTDALGRPVETTARWEPILLNPLFWQCLSVGMGWCSYKNETTLWQRAWQDFIDHLIQGKDVNSFFDDLLSTQ